MAKITIGKVTTVSLELSMNENEACALSFFLRTAITAPSMPMPDGKESTPHSDIINQLGNALRQKGY